MTFTAAAHQRNRLLVRIYCWMTTCTNASQCYFGTIWTFLTMKIKLWPEDESVIKLWNICNKRMIENFLLFFFTVVSSDPALECLQFLESRLQETNNLPAFLANVRKEFISLARRWDWENWIRKRFAQSTRAGQIQATAAQTISVLNKHPWAGNTFSF